MSFRIIGLDSAPFAPFFGMTDVELASHGIKRVIVDAHPGYPDRIEVADAPLGASVLLLNYLHQPADTPYRSSHAIFVREGALETLDVKDRIPAALERRTISLRAFDSGHDMVEAELVDGKDLKAAIDRMLGDRQVSYLHAHYAIRGCYAARIERSIEALRPLA